MIKRIHVVPALETFTTLVFMLAFPESDRVYHVAMVYLLATLTYRLMIFYKT